jgi:hypothetical protein
VESTGTVERVLDGRSTNDPARSAVRLDLVWVSALVALSLFRNGFGVQDNRGFFAVRYVDALPGVPPLQPLSRWALWSPLGPIVARVAGLHSVSGFVALHVAAVIAGLVVLCIAVRNQYGSVAMRVGLLAFVALPISVVLQSWFGSYDAWTFLLSTTIVVTRSWKLAAVAGFALALANFEQGAVILVLLGVIATFGLYGSMRRTACAMAGLLAGRIALGIWLAHNGIHSGRLDYQRHYGLDYFITTAARSWFLLLLSLLAVAVLLVGNVYTGGSRQRVAMVIVLLAAIGPAFLAADETRVYALTTWPALLALLLGASVRTPDRLRRAITPTIALALLVPGFFVWDGHPYLADYHWLRLLFGH